MASQVTVEFAATDAGVVKALNQQLSGILKNQEALIKMGDASKRSGQQAKSGFEDAAKSALSFASGLGIVTTATGAVQLAVGQLRREFENLKQAQADAAKTQTDTAGALGNASFALGKDPTLDVAGLERELGAISQESGVKIRDLATAAADVLSARGDKSAADALGALRAAAKLAPDQPGNLPVFAASALDISKGTGQTPEQALGQLLTVGTASRVTNLKGLAENVAPALIGLTKFGDTTTDAGALVAAVSQGVVDPTGAVSRTSATSLAAQLEEFLPGAGSTAARIATLQGDEKLRAKFLEKASFEKQFIPTARGLLSGDPNTPERLSYAAAQQSILSGPAAQAQMQAMLGQINSLPAVRNALLQQGLAASQERLQGLDIIGAEGSISRKGLQDVLKASGASDIAQRIEGLKFELESGGGTNNAVGNLLGSIQQRRDQLRFPSEMRESTIVGLGDTPGTLVSVRREPTPTEARQADELGNVVKLLETMIEESRRGNALMIEQNQILDRGGPGRPGRDPARPPGPRPSSALAKP